MKASERRKHARQPMRLDARLTGDGPDSLACEIRDFCVGGLFIAVPQVEAKDRFLLNQRELSPEDLVRVHFDLEGEDGPAEFEVKVRIAGTFNGGIGVEFHEADPPTIRALQGAAARQAKAPSDKAATGSPRGAVNASERGTLMARFRDLLSDFARTETEALFESADETLFVDARDAGSNVAEKEFIEVQQEVGKLKPVVSKAFSDTVMHGLEHMREGRLESASERSEKGLEGDAELSLVDTQNFGDILKVKQILGRSERHFKDGEYDLEQRLSDLLHVAVAQDNNPVGVHAMCYAFHDAVQNLGATKLARSTIFDAFEHTLIVKLVELQESFREALEEAGLAGEGTDRKYHVPKQPKAAKPAPRPDEVPAEPAEPSATAADVGAPTPQPGPRDAAVTASAASAPPVAAPSGPAAEQSGAAPDAATAGVAIPGHGMPAGAGIPLTNAFAAGRSLLQIGRQPSAAETASATPFSVSSTVMDEITRLQRARAGDPLSSTGPRMVLERVATAVEESGGSMSEGEQDAINVIASMLDCVLTDPLIGEGAKSRIHRLALPLIRVALSDASFFEDMEHPARRVVNQLGRVEFEGEDQAEAKALVDPLLDRMVSNRELDRDVFTEAVSWLERLVQDQTSSYADKVQKITESRDQQQALVKARVGDAKDREPVRRVPEELRKWLARARHLQVGDTVVMETRPGKRERALLAWIAEDKGTFQFVDPHGNKGPSLTEQQLAIELRRGSAKMLPGSDLPVLDRGLYKMLHEMHTKLADVATRDELTGLVNQREFELRLEEALDEARRAGSEHALCVLEIDDFAGLSKRSSTAGNSLLRQISRVLEKHIVDVPGGSVARLEANAFGVLLTGVSESEGCEFAERQRRAIDKSRCVWKGEKLPLSVSVGVVNVGPDSPQAVSLLAAARAACLSARDTGGNRVALGGAPTAEPEEPAEGLPIWTGSVEKVLEGELLVLRAQRVQSLGDGNGMKPHFEILLGVRNAEGEIFRPREFIQAAESSNLMPTVDRWVIRNTLKWMAQHRKDMLKSDGYAINLSASTLADDSLIEFIIEQLTESKVPPAKVVFEMKESVALQSLSNASDFVRVLKEYGCRASLDHFGTGDASFSYLKRLSVDYVKIDGSFVRDMVDNPNDLAVVRSVNEVGHLLGIRTVAPFVEDDAILEPLRKIGVDFAQGFGIERPEVLEWN